MCGHSIGARGRVGMLTILESAKNGCERVGAGRDRGVRLCATRTRGRVISRRNRAPRLPSYMSAGSSLSNCPGAGRVLECKKKMPDIATPKQLAGAMKFAYDSIFLENLRRVGFGKGLVMFEVIDMSKLPVLYVKETGASFHSQNGCYVLQRTPEEESGNDA